MPRHVIYILRHPPISTRRVKSARGAEEAAIVVPARSAVEFVVEPAHPAISGPAPSARARTAASIRRIEKLLK